MFPHGVLAHKPPLSRCPSPCINLNYLGHIPFFSNSASVWNTRRSSTRRRSAEMPLCVRWRRISFGAGVCGSALDYSTDINILPCGEIDCMYGSDARIKCDQSCVSQGQGGAGSGGCLRVGISSGCQCPRPCVSAGDGPRTSSGGRGRGSGRGRGAGTGTGTSPGREHGIASRTNVWAVTSWRSGRRCFEGGVWGMREVQGSIASQSSESKQRL